MSSNDRLNRKRGWLSILGPGLITGASDDDPSGIATYSQVGAQFGLGMLWTMLFSYPLMSAIQEVSAWIGRVTGRGIAENVRRHYPPWLLFCIVPLLFVANTLNVAADIGAMGSCAALLIGGPPLIYVICVGTISLLLEVFVPYTRYVRYLKWLTLILFSYMAAACFVRIPWGRALHSALAPSLSLDKAFLTSLIAVLGTTLSPYMQFWQASEEAEEVHVNHDEGPLKRSPKEAPTQLHRIRVDTYVGMAFSNLVAFFIILTTAATPHAHGIKDIQTPQQAAAALGPLAGRSAFLLFTVGIIGTGFLAVPVLAGSAAYALGEALRWRVGREARPERAKGFYGIIVGSTLIGVLLNLLRINPIKALFWCAVINGLVAVPVMVMLMLMASQRRVMGAFTLPGYLKASGWTATGVMVASVLGLFATWGR